MRININYFSKNLKTYNDFCNTLASRLIQMDKFINPTRKFMYRFSRN